MRGMVRFSAPLVSMMMTTVDNSMRETPPSMAPEPTTAYADRETLSCDDGTPRLMREALHHKRPPRPARTTSFVWSTRLKALQCRRLGPRSIPGLPHYAALPLLYGDVQAMQG